MVDAVQRKVILDHLNVCSAGFSPPKNKTLTKIIHLNHHLWPSRSVWPVTVSAMTLPSACILILLCLGHFWASKIKLWSRIVDESHSKVVKYQCFGLFLSNPSVVFKNRKWKILHIMPFNTAVTCLIFRSTFVLVSHRITEMKFSASLMPWETAAQ